MDADLIGSAPAQPSTPAREISAHARRHKRMRDAILAERPELRALYGPQPLQLLPIVALLVMRWGLAYALRDSPLLLIGAIACTVGCWTVHAAGTFAHENAHGLIVGRGRWAQMVDLLIEASMTSFGKMVGYQYRHTNFHHRYLGDYEWDSEMRDLCQHVAVIKAEDVRYAGSRALQGLEAALALVPGGGLFAQDLVVGLRTRLIMPSVSPTDSIRASRFALPLVRHMLHPEATHELLDHRPARTVLRSHDCQPTRNLKHTSRRSIAKSRIFLLWFR